MVTQGILFKYHANSFDSALKDNRDGVWLRLGAEC